jgi:hypothetical protein
MRRRILALVSSAAIAAATLLGAPGPAQASDPTGPFEAGCQVESLGLPEWGKIMSGSGYPIFDDQRIYKCMQTPYWHWTLREVCPGDEPVTIYGPTLALIGGWFMVNAVCEPVDA